MQARREDTHDVQSARRLPRKARIECGIRVPCDNLAELGQLEAAGLGQARKLRAQRAIGVPDANKERQARRQRCWRGLAGRQVHKVVGALPVLGRDAGAVARAARQRRQSFGHEARPELRSKEDTVRIRGARLEGRARALVARPVRPLALARAVGRHAAARAESGGRGTAHGAALVLPIVLAVREEQRPLRAASGSSKVGASTSAGAGIGCGCGRGYDEIARGLVPL
jgi:hypothetical protein